MARQKTRTRINKALDPWSPRVPYVGNRGESSDRSEKRSHIKTKRRPVVEDDAADAFHPARFYRTKRLAQLLDCDESTVWKMRKRGDLPEFTRVGNIKGLTGPQLKAVLQQREGK